MSEVKFQERWEEREKQNEDRAEGRVCRSCSHVNDVDAMFCEECGNGFESTEKACPVCGEMNSGVYCSFCGACIEGYTCGGCNSLQYSDFCANCGEPLTDMARDFTLECESGFEAAEMSEQEAASILQELNTSLTPEILRESGKRRERIILLRERDYFNEREKRIEESKTDVGRKVKIITPDEMKIIKESIVRLRESGIKEAERIEKDQLEAQRLEKEKTEAERIESEKIRGISGVWINTSGKFSGILKITVSGKNISGTLHWIQRELERIETVSGTIKNNRISIKTVRMKTVWILPGYHNVPFRYSAVLNNSGNQMNGYMNSAEYWSEIFIRQE